MSTTSTTGLTTHTTPKTSNPPKTLNTAKVFTTGRSQAVRLPKAFRFDTDEATIEKVGNAVVLRPKQSREEWWVQMESALNALRDVTEPVERNRTPPRDDIASFD